MRSYLLGALFGLLAGSVSAQDIQTIERPLIIVELRGEAPGWAPEIVIELDGAELLRTRVSSRWQDVAVRLPDGHENARAVSVGHVTERCSGNSLFCNSAQAEVFLREITFAGDSLRASNATIERSGERLSPGETRYFLRGIEFSQADQTAEGIAYVDDLLQAGEQSAADANDKPQPCQGGDTRCETDETGDIERPHGLDVDCDPDILASEPDDAEFRRLNALLAARMSILDEVHAAQEGYEDLKLELWHENPDNHYPGMDEAPRFLELMPDDIEAASLSDFQAGIAHLRGLASLPAAPYGAGAIEPAAINEAIGWHARFIAALERLERAERAMSDLRAALSCD
ncbi:hypothetical protein [Maricaulis sp.]|uniref:hypothetical protein n=1 Tax=Maricaulis sp. TaxID=1486257 RepID=UPI002B277CB3|nr:hypothetical protein [Maricaulis sp.]